MEPHKSCHPVRSGPYTGESVAFCSGSRARVQRGFQSLWWHCLCHSCFQSLCMVAAVVAITHLSELHGFLLPRSQQPNNITTLSECINQHIDTPVWPISVAEEQATPSESVQCCPFKYNHRDLSPKCIVATDLHCCCCYMSIGTTIDRQSCSRSVGTPTQSCTHGMEPVQDIENNTGCHC